MPRPPLRYKSEGPGIDSRCRRGFFPWHLTVPCALGSTQPLKISSRLILGVMAAGRKADNLPPSCADVKKSGGLNLLEPCGPVMGQLFTCHALTSGRASVVC
jgi:hypothetical protein